MESFNDAIVTIGVGGFLLLMLALYIWAAIKIHKRSFDSLREKSLWLTLVVLAPLLGSMIFLMWDARSKKNNLRRQLH